MASADGSRRTAGGSVRTCTHRTPVGSPLEPNCVGRRGRVQRTAVDVRTRLAAERAATEQRVAALTADLDGVAAASAGSNLDDEHDPEGATVAFEREQLAAARAQARGTLAALDAALARLAAGTYGTCARCGGPVGAERLEALPAAELCVRCAGRR